MEHEVQVEIINLEILESQSEQEMRLIYCIIHQLRDNLTIDEFLQRVMIAKRTGYRLFYALVDQRVMGAIGVRILDDLCWGHHLYVHDLVVDESLRSQGIGKVLMKYAEGLANSESCEYIRLASGISRAKAHKFYESLGYRKTRFSFTLKL